jgi:hypothetical protein
MVYIIFVSSYSEIKHCLTCIQMWYSFFIILSVMNLKVLYRLTRTQWQDKLCYEMEMGFFYMKEKKYIYIYELHSA